MFKRFTRTRRGSDLAQQLIVLGMAPIQNQINYSHPALPPLDSGALRAQTKAADLLERTDG